MYSILCIRADILACWLKERVNFALLSTGSLANYFIFHLIQGRIFHTIFLDKPPQDFQHFKLFFRSSGHSARVDCREKGKTSRAPVHENLLYPELIISNVYYIHRFLCSKKSVLREKFTITGCLLYPDLLYPDFTVLPIQNIQIIKISACLDTETGYLRCFG